MMTQSSSDLIWDYAVRLSEAGADIDQAYLSLRDYEAEASKRVERNAATYISGAIIAVALIPVLALVGGLSWRLASWVGGW